jgi:predicted nucleic acid-binding protein
LLSKFNYVITSILNVIEYPSILDLKERLLIVYPMKGDYELALKIMINLRKIGELVNVVDIILSSIAINRNMIVVTNDIDFESIRKVEKG